MDKIDVPGVDLSSVGTSLWETITEQQIQAMYPNSTVTVSSSSTSDPLEYQPQITITDMTTGDAKAIKLYSNTVSGNWQILPGTTTVPAPNTWTVPSVPIIPSAETEWVTAQTSLDEASMDALNEVRTRLEELLGKHPYAGLARKRKALDTVLHDLEGDWYYEGCDRVELQSGHIGWIGKLRSSDGEPVGTEAMPTEEEAVAELIRIASAF